MGKQPEIRFLGDMERLQIQPGDKFVITVDQVVSDEFCSHIRAAWKMFAGEDSPLLILQRGMKLGAVNVTVAPADDA